MAAGTLATFTSISPPNFRRNVTSNTENLKPPRFPAPIPPLCAYSKHVVIWSTSVFGNFEKSRGEETNMRQEVTSSTGKFRTVRVPVRTRRLSAYTVQAAMASVSGSFEKKQHEEEATAAKVLEVESGASLKDYFELSKEFIKPDGGPPRWFSPLECGSRLQDSPLLLFLPGFDGVGLGLILHHQRLGGIFNIWCLHIPVMDRTSFTDLVKLVERTIMSENYYAPNRPIYLVGESLGACLALAVAARNPHIDLVLVLANPATSFEKSMLVRLIPIFRAMPDNFYRSLPYTLSVAEGDPLRMAISSFEKGLSLQQTFGDLSQSLIVLSSYFSVMVDILPRETLLWKLQLLKSASSYVNSRLHAIKAQTMILASAKDRFLPSQEEGVILCRALQNCEMRKFDDSGHFLFWEGGMDLVTILKGASFYRRGRYHDYVSDYVPVTPSEFKHIYEPHRWMEIATSPVMLSTLENGEIVRGLSGIPLEGPVLLVGYHMLLGLELISLVSQFYIEKNIIVRGIAHPMLFKKLKDGKFPDISTFDTTRVMGAVPVSAKNFFKLISSKSHALLYPGGMREALHRKGEQYKLFWPEQSEFVRVAARFGATIIPFGTVGEDDIGEVLFDYNDQMKIPYFKSLIQELTEETIKLRLDAVGEVSNQDVHSPWILPKVPGRFYFLFGKPIETEGMKQELKDRDKSHELYLQVKSEVESCITYLKDKRENDPYRNILPRLIYQAQNGFSSEVPTFKL